MRLATHCIPVFLAAAAMLAWLANPPVAGAASQYVIVAAEPPAADFAPGRLLSPGDTLNVPGGTVVTLLGEDGSVNVIPGPAEVTVTEDSVRTGGSAAAGGERRSTLSKIAGLLAGERGRAESLGVSRGLASSPAPRGLDDPWVVAVDESAPGCLREGRIVLGRANSGAAASVTARLDDGPPAEALVWPSGEATLALPMAVSPTARQLALEVDGRFVRIDLRSMPDETNIKNPLGVLGWMLSSGCDRQALAFARGLAGGAK